ncbi:hypothetical protein GCM10009616_06650 [Microlunatus lacustris]
MRAAAGVLLGCVLALAAVSALSRQVVPLAAASADRAAGPARVERDGDLPAVGPGQPGVTGSSTQALSVPTAVGPTTGTAVLPQGRAPAGGWPGVVLVHGSGDGRGTAMLPWAVRFAERGVAAVVYDKRVEGYSAVRRDFGALADDAVAAAAALRGVPGVDPSRIALAGFSEGGWVVPLAAARDPRLIGVVQLSGPDVTPNQQIAWQLHSGLVEAGAPVAARSSLLNALALPFPGELMAFGRFDPRPSLTAADLPLLAVFGLADRTVPVEDGAATVLDSRRSTDASTTVLLVPGLGHGLSEAGQPSATVVGLVADWLVAPPTGPAVEVRGGAARQRQATPVLGRLSAGLTAVLLTSGTLVLVGLVLNLLGRRRALAGTGAHHQPWDVAAGAGLVAAVGNHLGLAGLAAAGALGAGPVVAALAWSVVKLASAAAVLLTARAAVLDPPTRARPGQGVRRAGGMLAALGGVGLAVVGGALTSVW